MKKLHLYMLKSYLGPFVFTFFVALFILLLQFLWKYLDDLVGKGLEWVIIAKLMFYASSTFVPLALPLAILLSSLMTFGNLGENYELVSMKAAGISLRKAMKPLVILSIILSISAFYFSNYVLPVANLKFGSLLYDVRQQKLAFDLDEGIFNKGVDNIVIHVGRKDQDNKTIYDVKIYDHSQKLGNVEVIAAKKGIMELSADQSNIIFTLFDGARYTEITDQAAYKKSRPFEILYFDKFIRAFDLTQFELSRTNEDLFKSHYTMLNISQLNQSIDSLSNSRQARLQFFRQKFIKKYPYLSVYDTTIPVTASVNRSPVRERKVYIDKETEPGDDTLCISYPLLTNFDTEINARVIENALTSARNAKDDIIFYENELDSRQLVVVKHEVVWHQKFQLSFACLIFFFIGAPLGAIIRKGGLGLPVVISVVFFVLYHIVSMTGEKAAKTGEWDVVFGIWLSTALILPLGLFLTYKATTDAPLLDSESWKKFFDRLKIIRFKKKKSKS